MSRDSASVAGHPLPTVEEGNTLRIVLGLALGMAALLLLLLVVRAEWSYDRFHEKADRIYRVYQAFQSPPEPITWAVVSPLPLAAAIRRDFPKEVVESARILPFLEGSLPGKVTVRSAEGKQSYESFVWADEGLPRIFSLPLVAGDPAKSLKEPNTLLLSESAARRYFGSAPAVGKTLKIDSGFSDEDYRVSGVFRDLPYNSHFHFDIFASFNSLDHVKDPRILRDDFWASDAQTYVLLAKGVRPEQVEKRFPAFVAKTFGIVKGLKEELYLQPVKDIHLRSHQLGELEVNGDVKSVYILSAAALLTLLIAGLNFMVLATGRPFRRSLLLSAVAMALALILVRLALPGWNALTGKPMTLPWDLPSLLVLAALVLLPSLAAAGSSGFARTGAGGAFRKTLAGLQVAVAVGLLIGAFVLYQKVRAFRAGNLGFDPRNVVVVPLRGVGMKEKLVPLKAAMSRLPNVQGTTFSSLVLGGKETPQIGVVVKGIKGYNLMATLMVDPDFTRVFHIEPVAGRAFAPDEGDAAKVFLWNRQALRLWHLRSPEALGRKMNWNGLKSGQVVGILPNFHYKSLQYPVEPLLLLVRPIAFRYMYLRLAPQGVEATMRELEGVWRGLIPDRPLEHYSLADHYDQAYEGEARVARIVGWGGLAGLLIAGLALPGLLGIGGIGAKPRRGETGHG